MAVKLRKPILVVGIGVSIALGIWESFHNELIEVGEWGMLGAIALGSGFWWLKNKTAQPLLTWQPISPLKRETVEAAIGQAEAMLPILEKEAPERDISGLKAQIAQLPLAFTRQDLQIAIAGGKKVGKTSLKQVLESQPMDEKVHLVETEALLSESEALDKAAQATVLSSDLVLFLTAGDLTESEWQILQQWQRSHQRLILLFNKQDTYIPEERSLILRQLQQRVQVILAEADIIPIAAAPNSLKVRQHQEDGSAQEWLEEQTAEISLLQQRLMQVLSQEQEQMVWGTIWRDAKRLQHEAKQILNQTRRDRALPIIEQYQWLAAAASFANPVAAIDLLATAAINAQLLVDLSDIYQQKFSLSQAQTTAATIGQLMVKLGLVELSSQAIASLLKSNALTYVAGGAIQGVSAAYLTRLAGLSLIEYFQEQEISLSTGEGFNLEKLGQKLKQVFEQNQRTSLLPSFVQQAISHLSPTSS